MEMVKAPRLVRFSSALIWATAVTGLLLVIAGLVELHWWGTPAPAKLAAIFTDIARQDGPSAPILLRGHGGAIQLLIMGAVTVAFGALAPLLIRGRRWARTAALVASTAITLVALAALGVDATDVTGLTGYFNNLAGSGFAARIPEIQALLYPGWYSWLEDLAQAAHAAAALACLVMLGWTVIHHADYFTTKKTDQAGPDVWQETLSRIHHETVGNDVQ